MPLGSGDSYSKILNQLEPEPFHVGTVLGALPLQNRSDQVDLVDETTYRGKQREDQDDKEYYPNGTQQ